MDRKTSAVLIAAALLAGCGGGSWVPWGKSAETVGPYTPPGAKGYACEGGKRLLVRLDADGKSAWVIYPDREFRLNRVTAAAGEQFSNATTTLAVKDGEAMLSEGGRVEFAKCKLEKAP